MLSLKQHAVVPFFCLTGTSSEERPSKKRKNNNKPGEDSECELFDLAQSETSEGSSVFTLHSDEESGDGSGWHDSPNFGVQSRLTTVYGDTDSETFEAELAGGESEEGVGGGEGAASGSCALDMISEHRGCHIPLT